jgi:hypothetical protein
MFCDSRWPTLDRVSPSLAMFDIAKGTIRLRSEMSKNAEERVLTVVG